MCRLCKSGVLKKIGILAVKSTFKFIFPFEFLYPHAYYTYQLNSSWNRMYRSFSFNVMWFSCSRKFVKSEYLEFSWKVYRFYQPCRETWDLARTFRKIKPKSVSALCLPFFFSFQLYCQPLSRKVVYNYYNNNGILNNPIGKVSLIQQRKSRRL